jgi:5-formyltetrahydrofolate cyclo-ligase
MVSPDEALLQVRLNALQDGKRLIMASPGLREGFYELTGQDLPLSHWSRAVRASGVQALGRRLGTSRGAVGRVDLLITGAVAVDVAGRRVGKGKGFFDLAFAILDHLGCIEEETPMVGLVHERQILPGVPCSPGDVPLDWIITPERCIPCQGRGPRPNGIPWERLSFRQIRQMRPRWEIRRMPGERASGV